LLSVVLVAMFALAFAGAAQAEASKKVSVKSIQRALGVRADGVMGPKTRRAIKRFQRAHDLKVDGIAGRATLRALGLAGAPQARKLENADDVLAQIAQCESGGDPTVVSANGRYFGKYQFSRATWKDLGGEGKPSEADEATQDELAAKLYAARGTAPWPACAPDDGDKD
jgi:peptidoglycan hydrolase-like protein with peptidoglycan-binding domain